LAGRNITRYFSRLLQSKGYNFKSNSGQKLIEVMKEKLCYLALDYKKEVEKAKNGECDEQYELPDGRIISLGQPRFEACESLFNPSMLGMEGKKNNKKKHLE
jgi:actin, other eukaryote